MKTALHCLLLVLLISACTKHKEVSVSDSNIQDSNKIIQVAINSPAFVAFTDTFFGTVYESNYSPTALDSVAQLQVYLRHTAPDQIMLSSMGTHGGAGVVYVNSNQCTINDSNCYAYKLDAEHYYSFRLIKDSIYYDDCEQHCPDVIYTHYAGKKIRKQPGR
jgi:hypothetical protein